MSLVFQQNFQHQIIYRLNVTLSDNVNTNDNNNNHTCNHYWQSTNAGNVSFQSLHGGQFTSSTQLINPKFCVQNKKLRTNILNRFESSNL